MRSCLKESLWIFTTTRVLVKSAFYPSPESADEVLRRHDGVHARPRSSASGARLLRAASYCLRVGWCDGLDCSHIWQPQMRGHW